MRNDWNYSCQLSKFNIRIILRFCGQFSRKIEFESWIINQEDCLLISGNLGYKHLIRKKMSFNDSQVTKMNHFIRWWRNQVESAKDLMRMINRCHQLWKKISFLSGMHCWHSSIKIFIFRSQKDKFVSNLTICCYFWPLIVQIFRRSFPN